MRLEANTKSDPTGEDILNASSPWVEIRVGDRQNANAARRKFPLGFNHHFFRIRLLGVLLLPSPIAN